MSLNTLFQRRLWHLPDLQSLGFPLNLGVPERLQGVGTAGCRQSSEPTRLCLPAASPAGGAAALGRALARIFTSLLPAAPDRPGPGLSVQGCSPSASRTAPGPRPAGSLGQQPGPIGGCHVQGHSRAQLPAQAQPQIPAEPGPRHSPCPSTTLTTGRARHGRRPRHSPGPGTTPGHSPRTRHSSNPGHSPCPRYSSGPYPRPSPSPGTAPEGCGGRTAAGPASARCGGQAPPPGRGAKVRTASAVCLFLVCFSLNPIPETKGESGRNYGSVWPRIQSGAPVVTRRLPRAAQP